MTEARTFYCSICGDPSTQICVYCTKDSCANHLCRKCLRCSDCCECDVPLDAAADQPAFGQPSNSATQPPPAPPVLEPEPEPPAQES